MVIATRPPWVVWVRGLWAAAIPLLALTAVMLAAGPAAAQIITNTTSSTRHTTVTTSQVDVAVAAQSTRVVGRAGPLLTSPIVYDKTFALPASDPAVVAAFADAAAAVQAAGFVPASPVLTSDQDISTVATSSQTNVQDEVLVTTELTIGPGVILIGPDQSVTHFVPAGTNNFNTNTHTETFEHTTVTMTTTTTDTEVYQVLASIRPDPPDDATVTDLLGQQQDLMAAMTGDQLGSFAKRLEKLHGVDPAGSSIGVVVADAYAPVAGTLGAAAIDMALGPEGSMASALGFWTDAALTITQPDGRALDITSGAVTFGADYRFTDWATLGAGAGIAAGHTATGPNGEQTSADAYYAAIYGSLLPPGNAFIDGVLGVGVIDLSSTRYVAFNDALAEGRRGGHEIFGSLAAGYDAALGDVTLSGYGRLEAAFARLGAFTETGGGPGGALSFAAQDLWSVTALLGVRADYSFHLENGTLTPSVRAEYRHNTQRSSDTSVAFADLPAVPFGFTGRSVTGDSLLLGLETEFEFAGGLTIALGGNVRVGTGGTVSKGISFYLGGTL